jgi:TPR repeat protein
VQYNLGPLYQNGQGVPQDMAQARAWIQKAAVGYDNAYKWLAIN